MATTTVRARCSTCYKETSTFICEGCSQSFCRNDLTKHFQSLSEQLDKIENNHDELRQKLIDKKTDRQQHSLIQQIDKWEKDSINKIKQTAEECKQIVFKYTNKFIGEIENQLNELAKKIKHIRDEDAFNEIDLNQLKEKFKKLAEELDKPSNVSIEQGSSSFINKIFVIIPLSKGNNHILLMKELISSKLIQNIEKENVE